MTKAECQEGVAERSRFDIGHLPFGIGHWAFGIAFILLATLNSAGYRYAASDQAFYIPAILRHLDPAIFPRDAALIDSQARLTTMDDIVAGAVRATGISLQHLFVGLYVATLVLLLAGAARIGARLYRTRWTVVAIGAALTLRHAVAKTGANTLEGYFHPRQLAFALGLLAVAGFLERRDRLLIPLLLAAAAMHPTTALWFGVWVGVGLWLARPDWRKAMAALALLIAAGGAVVVTRGPLAGHLARMDSDWLSVIADRDYLFPIAWPLNVWFTNLIAVPVLLFCWRARQRAGLTVARETPLVLGALALVAVFFCWLPFNAVHIALAVEMQVTRVFWMLDVLATIYVVGVMAEGVTGVGGNGAKGANGAGAKGAGAKGAGAKGTARRAAMVAGLLLAASLARGVYACFVQFPDRKIFAIDIQHPDWRDAMAWAQTTDPGSGWLADPVHAAKYGSSLRAAGRRDVLLEQLKDRAIAMYDRDVAMHVADRERALAALAWDTPDGARGLARRFGLDYLIIDRELELPLVHRSGSLFIYRIR
jgi:hypothetical protein